MKGLSTILAMILIVIIVVALIGLTYTFAANLFQTTTETASTTVSTTTKNMDKRISVVGDVVCKNVTGNGFNVTFTLRDEGSQYSINTDRFDEITAIFNNEVVNNNKTVVSGTSPLTGLGNTTIRPSYLYTVTIINQTNSTTNPVMLGTSYKLRFSTPAGEISESFTCVSA